ncbi:MAG: ATP-binding cassette domain-containing protein [Candidatus Dormibacter sp.]
MSLRDDVTVRRGGLHLVVSLNADARGIMAVLGPNGAGKTTLLRTLAGLPEFESGRVELDGAVLEDTARGLWLAPEKRSVGLA